MCEHAHQRTHLFFAPSTDIHKEIHLGSTSLSSHKLLPSASNLSEQYAQSMINPTSCQFSSYTIQHSEDRCTKRNLHPRHFYKKLAVNVRCHKQCTNIDSVSLAHTLPHSFFLVFFSEKKKCQ